MEQSISRSNQLLISNQRKVEKMQAKYKKNSGKLIAAFDSY